MDARDVSLKRFTAWCLFRAGSWYYTEWELSWLATTSFGARQLKKPDVSKWADPIYEAFIAGAWFISWTTETLYWVAKPTVRKDERRRAHSTETAACENDVENMYAIEGVLLPAYAVVKPEWITAKEIDEQQNAEARRILIERMGAGKYLSESGAKILQADHETARKGAAPRLLIQDNSGQKWLVGTDGSTTRVYYMPVLNEVKTCHEAHCAIAGFDEARILAKS